MSAQTDGKDHVEDTTTRVTSKVTPRGSTKSVRKVTVRWEGIDMGGNEPPPRWTEFGYVSFVAKIPPNVAKTREKFKDTMGKWLAILQDKNKLSCVLHVNKDK